MCSAWHRLEGIGIWTNTTTDWSGVHLIVSQKLSRAVYGGDKDAIAELVDEVSAFREAANRKFVAISLRGIRTGGVWMVIGDRRVYAKMVRSER